MFSSLWFIFELVFREIQQKFWSCLHCCRVILPIWYKMLMCVLLILSSAVTFTVVCCVHPGSVCRLAVVPVPFCS